MLSSLCFLEGAGQAAFLPCLSLSGPVSWTPLGAPPSPCADKPQLQGPVPQTTSSCLLPWGSPCHIRGLSANGRPLWLLPDQKSCWVFIPRGTPTLALHSPYPITVRGSSASSFGSPCFRPSCPGLMKPRQHFVTSSPYSGACSSSLSVRLGSSPPGAPASSQRFVQGDFSPPPAPRLLLDFREAGPPSPPLPHPCIRSGVLSALPRPELPAPLCLLPSPISSRSPGRGPKPASSYF